MPRMVHNSAVELAPPLFRRKRKRINTGSRSAVDLKSFSFVGRCYSAGSYRRFSPFFSDRFERRGLVYIGSSIQHKTAADAVFAEYDFTWDAGNRIIEIDSTDGTAEYTYDKTGQLTGADYDYITDELYTYDDNGNRTNAGYVTGENNETLSDGVYRYSYDNEGNRTEKFLWTDTNNDGIIDASEKTLVQSYEWDYRNRLSSVTNYENGIAKEVMDYLYDYLNLMIERTVTDAATSALQASDFNIYSNGQVVLEYDTTSSVDVVKSINLWGANIDELAAVEQMAQNVNDNNVILWTYGDHLNSIRDVLIYDSITQTAAVVNHLIYNAFGILVSSTDGSANPVSISPLLNYRYTGKYFDDSTGLQNNINRWYDNTTGKWLSVDPIGFNCGDANLYRYVGNSSTIKFDAYGLKWTIIRNGETTATAIRDNLQKDTIKDLADILGLNESEYNSWLIPTDQPCVFKIPNTIYAFWGGDEVLGIGQWWVSWKNELNILRSKGFYVRESYFNDTVKDDELNGEHRYLLEDRMIIPQIKILSDQKYLHGIIWWSHGCKPNQLINGELEPTFLAIRNVSWVRYSSVESSLKYKLGFVLINACYGQAGAQSWASSNPNAIILASPNKINPVFGGGIIYDKMLWVKDGYKKSGIQGTN